MSDDEVNEAIERHLSELSDVETELRALDAAKDKKIKAIVDEYAPQVDPLTVRRDELTAEIAKLWVEHEAELTTGHGKTAIYRNGTLSSRSSQGSLVIEDKNAAMKYLRSRGLLRRFTKVGERTIVKDALKKERDLVEKMPGVHLDVPEHLHIKLVRVKIELKQLLNPFRVRTK